MTGHDIPRTEDLPYPWLPESHKKRYPFTLAAPSFIYPDHIPPNAVMLAPFVDEIELVLFESAPPQNLPSAEDIRELDAISKDRDITYNVHLPIDVIITNADPKARQAAIGRTVRAAEAVQSLAPSTWTLHLPFTETARDEAQVRGWQKRATRAAEQLLCAVRMDPRAVCVETLDYPPAWLAPVTEALDLSVCLDIGHLMEHGYAIADAYERFAGRISVIHLYGGVIPRRGHASLDHLPEEVVAVVAGILSRFTGTVCLEVFSYADLKASLAVLKRLAGATR